MNSFLKDLLSVGTSKIVIIICGIAQNIITARWLGPEGNGIISSLIVYPSLFMTIGSLGVRQSATYLVGKKEYPEEVIKTSLFQIWLFTSILSLSICYILISNFSSFSKNPYWVFLAILPIPFSLFNTYNSGIFLGKNEINQFNKINWIPNALILFATAILVIALGLDISGVLLAIVFGQFFMFFILLFKNNFISAFHFKFQKSTIKKLLSLGMIYALSLLIANLNYKADIILLTKLSTPFELGIYSKGVSITEYLWQIPMLLSTLVFARSATTKDGRAFSEKVAQLLRLSFILIVLGSAILFVFAKWIILYMYGEKFINSIIVLQWLLPGVLLLTVFKVLNMDLAGKGKPWLSMIAMSPALVLNLVANYFLIPLYGAKGAALSSTVSYSFAAILFTYLYCKELDMPFKDLAHFKKSDFYPLKVIYKKLSN